jgi:hypothetical protein
MSQHRPLDEGILLSHPHISIYLKVLCTLTFSYWAYTTYLIMCLLYNVPAEALLFDFLGIVDFMRLGITDSYRFYCSIVVIFFFASVRGLAAFFMRRQKFAFGYFLYVAACVIDTIAIFFVRAAGIYHDNHRYIDFIHLGLFAISLVFIILYAIALKEKLK